MKWNLAAAAGAAVMMAFVTPVAQANSISSVENARAKDRAGYYLSRQDREKLRQYGRESDPGWGYRGYDYGYDGRLRVLRAAPILRTVWVLIAALGTAETGKRLADGDKAVVGHGCPRKVGLLRRLLLARDRLRVAVASTGFRYCPV